jgi:hypothetical protein
MKVQDTMKELVNKIGNSGSISKEKKTELLSLLSVLESEINDLSQTNAEHAESIVRFAHAHAHETTRTEKMPQLRHLSLEGLQESVRGLENSHPKLVEIVNSICSTLANLGI